MLSIKLVTFDITGTLLYFTTPVVEKYLQIGLKYGIKADFEDLGKNFKKTWKALNKEHPNFGKDSGIGWQNWWRQFVEKTFTSYIITGERTKISQIVDDLIEFHKKKEAFTIRPGAEDLLQYLKRKNVKLGVISNYDPRLHGILEITDLKKYFDFVLISYEFGCTKPDKRIFEEALRLGNCSGTEAVHVGDDVELDYLGAKQSGIKSILIYSHPDILNKTGVDINDCYEDFFKLKEFFRKL